MADLSYEVAVNTSQAERNLANLQKSVADINNAFAGLKGVLAGISLGALISQAINMADAIQDLSDATEISTTTILGFSRAVQANGGSAEAAQKGLAKLVGSIDEAANKAGESRNAFNDVGISLEELRTLSAEDIFKRTIEGLGRIDDVTKRAALSTKLLGKEFRGVNVQGVGQGFAGSVAASRNYADSIRSAADAQQKLETALNNLQLALLKAVKPLADFVAQIDLQKLDIFVDRLIKIGAALAGLFVASKAASAVRGLVDGYRMLTVGGVQATGMMAEAGLGLKQLGQAFDLNSARTVASYTRFGVLDIKLKSLAGGFIRLVPIIGAAFAAFQLLDGAVEMLTGRSLSGWFDQFAAATESWVTSNFPKLAAALNSLGKAMGMAPPPSEVAAAEKAAKDHLANLKEQQDEVDAVRKKQAELIRGQEALAKLAADMAKQAAAYKLINDEQVRFSQSLFDNLAFQRASIGLTDDELEVRTRVKEETDRHASAVQSLKDKQASLRAEMIGEKDAEKIKLIGNEISLINGTLTQAESLHQLNKKRIEEQIPVIQGLRMVEAARKQDIENMTRAIEAQIARQQQLGDIIRGANDQRVGIRFESSLQGLSPMQREIARINESARTAALEAGRAFAETFPEELTTQVRELEDGTKEYYGTAVELANGLEQIAQGYRNVANEQIKSLQATREWSAGWGDTMKKFGDDLTNAAEFGRQAADMVIGGIGDMFDIMFRKSKTNFKDMVLDMIRNLAILSVKVAAMNFLKASAGSGGLLGSLASIFGFANGGPIQGGVPSIVGERGPELFVPKTAGQVITNSTLRNMNHAQPVQNTYVTNNIQAVDAKSVAQLFYENRMTMFGTVEQARKELPFRGSRS